jgi:hypothetical protein
VKAAAKTRYWPERTTRFGHRIIFLQLYGKWKVPGIQAFDNHYDAHDFFIPQV